MQPKKFNPKTVKVGQKCKINLPGHESFSYVQFLGLKANFYLYKDLNVKYLIYGLSFQESLNLVMNY